jgi:GxxExxY protein
VTENELSKDIVDAAIKIHRALGAGLLESVYEVVLAHELESRGMSVRRQVPIAIDYNGIVFEEGFKADVIINNKVILELKSVEEIKPVHKKQLQTYLKLTGCKLGFLLNFNTSLMKDGITRCVNGLKEENQKSPLFCITK